MLIYSPTSRRRFLGQAGLVGLTISAATFLPRLAMAAWNKPAFDAKTLDEAYKGMGVASPTASADIQLLASDIAENGAVVSFGAASVPTLSLAMSGRKARNLSVHLIFVYLLSEPAFAATCAGIIAAEEAGALRHRVGGVYPLAELARAHADAEATTGTGHFVVEA